MNINIQNGPNTEQVTQLFLTDEQKPRFIEAVTVGKALPQDITLSFMSQLSPSSIQLTQDQLNRLNAAEAASEPVPSDIRELVFDHRNLDRNETYLEGLLFEAACELNKTQEQLIDEVFRRQGLDPKSIIDYDVKN